MEYKKCGYTEILPWTAPMRRPHRVGAAEEIQEFYPPGVPYVPSTPSDDSSPVLQDTLGYTEYTG